MSLFTRLPENMAADFPQERRETKSAPGAQESEHPRRKPDLLVTQFQSVQPRLKWKRLRKCRTSWGNTYYVSSHFYSLNLYVRPPRIRNTVTCPIGRARIQIQLSMIPNLSSKPQYSIAFSDKSFSFYCALTQGLFCYKYVRVSCLVYTNAKTCQNAKSPRDTVIKTCDYLLFLNTRFRKVSVILTYKWSSENATEIFKEKLAHKYII